MVPKNDFDFEFSGLCLSTKEGSLLFPVRALQACFDRFKSAVAQSSALFVSPLVLPV